MKYLHFSTLLLITMLCLGNGMQAVYAADAPAAHAANAIPALEDMIKANELPYTKLENGTYKIVVQIDEQAMTVFAKEYSLGKTDDLKIIYLYGLVVSMPKGATPSAAMTKKMVELNDQLLVGKISLNENTVIYSSSFWLKNANSDTLLNELILAFRNKQDLVKTLKPFTTEE